jgi:hypothetical protein
MLFVKFATKRAMLAETAGHVLMMMTTVIKKSMPPIAWTQIGTRILVAHLRSSAKT